MARDSTHRSSIEFRFILTFSLINNDNKKQMERSVDSNLSKKKRIFNETKPLKRDCRLRSLNPEQKKFPEIPTKFFGRLDRSRLFQSKKIFE